MQFNLLQKQFGRIKCSRKNVFNIWESKSFQYLASGVILSLSRCWGDSYWLEATGVLSEEETNLYSTALYTIVCSTIGCIEEEKKHIYQFQFLTHLLSCIFESWGCFFCLCLIWGLILILRTSAFQKSFGWEALSCSLFVICSAKVTTPRVAKCHSYGRYICGRLA